jgi:hypothetical protein
LAWARVAAKRFARARFAAGVAALGLVATVASSFARSSGTHVQVASAQSTAPGVESTSTSPMTWTLCGTVEPPFYVADQRFADLDGKPGVEMCVVGHQGEVRVARRPDKGRGLAPTLAGDLVLAEPSRTIVALARIENAAATPALITASPRGVEMHRPDANGAIRAEAVVLLPRARFRIRVGSPRFAEFVQDINADGRNDLVLPSGEKLDVWIQQTVADAAAKNDRSDATKPAANEKSPPAPMFQRAASVDVQVSQSRSTEADELSRVLVSEFSIPKLTMQDVDGDGRADLCVKDGDVRSFHLVRSDGSIGEKPDVTLDLSIFRDTTPEAELKPGRTLAGGEQQKFETRDLDQDGIPDYVIAHRRKVWVFHGTKKGPQFTEPSTILKSDDDVTALFLADLDADGYPDLVLFKVQVPSIAAILKGLLREWEVEIDAAGYRNVQGKTFDPKPAWKSALFLRLPSILSIVRDPQSLIHRFEEVGRKFRMPTEGDFDGDGKTDVALVTDDSSAIDVWRGKQSASKDERAQNEALVRKIVFDDPEHTWDIDRVIAFMGGFAERRTELATGGRPSDARITLRDPADFDLAGIYAQDVDGDGRAEIVLRYVNRADGITSYDVWGAN